MGSLEKHIVRRIPQADEPSLAVAHLEQDLGLNFFEAPLEPWPILLTFQLENSADAHLYRLPHHLHTLLVGSSEAFLAPAVAPNFNNWL